MRDVTSDHIMKHVFVVLVFFKLSENVTFLLNPCLFPAGMHVAVQDLKERQEGSS